MKKKLFFLCALFLGYSSAFSQVTTLNDGRVGHFPLTTNGYDDVTATTYTSYNVMSVSGGLNGGNALSFNDATSYIDAGVSSRSITTQVSVSIWVKTTSTDAADVVLAKYNHLEDKGFTLYIKNGKASIDGRNGNSVYMSSGSSTTSVNDGNWHHIVGIANTTSFQIWVDGNKESEYIFPYCTVAYNTTDVNLLIGQNTVHPGNGDFYFYDGALNDLSIYNRTLNECEIKTLASQGNIASTLVGYFPLNGNTNDYSLTASNGTGSNLTSVTGRTAGTNAYSFNNSTSNITAGTGSRNISTAVTVSAWVKTSNTTDVTDCILSKYTHVEDKGYALLISNGKAKFDGRNGTSTYYSSGASSTSVNDGNWHHLIGVANGAGFQIWVDGVKESEYTFTIATPAYDATTQNLRIGRHCVHPGNGDFFYYGGVLSDVKIYNRTLLSCEIGTISETQHPGNNLVANFDLDNNTNDKSVLHINGTPYNITLTSPALTFNDVDSYIDAGNSSRGISSSVTASAWIKTTSTDFADCILAKYYHGDDAGFSLFIGGGKARFDGRNGNSTYYSSGPSTTTINDGEWHHIVGVANGTSFQIYVDGIKESEYTFTTTTPNYNTTSVNFLIGQNTVHPGNGDFYFFDGEIAKVKLFSNDLRSCEVATLYTEGAPSGAKGARTTDVFTKTAVSKITSVSPNPFDNQFAVNINNANNDPFEIVLSDSNGKVVGKHNGTDSSNIQLGEGLPAGLYVGKLVINEESYFFKVVKK